LRCGVLGGGCWNGGIAVGSVHMRRDVGKAVDARRGGWGGAGCGRVECGGGRANREEEEEQAAPPGGCSRQQQQGLSECKSSAAWCVMDGKGTMGKGGRQARREGKAREERREVREGAEGRRPRDGVGPQGLVVE
jgi:hypothetical protein